MKKVAFVSLMWLKYPDYTPDDTPQAIREYPVYVLFNHTINPRIAYLEWEGKSWKTHSEDVVIAFAPDVEPPNFN